MQISRRGALAALLGSACAWTQERDRPPNFVIILADDLGYGDLGCYGNPVIRTPNLDRMAAQGAKLTEFYAAPTCTPARASLLTGRYPIRSGMTRVLHPGENFGIPDSEINLAEALKERRYTTACIGKWHLGDRPQYRPNRQGFDYYYGLLYSNDMTLRPPNLQRLKLFRNNEPIESPVKQNTLTKRYTEQAIAFIEQNRATPFFVYLPHSMPHFPQHASEAFRGKSRRGIYGDAVEEIDWSTGEILHALQRNGLDRDTLVIFTSDNGPALGKGLHGGSAGPLRGGKHSTWEGGVRVPFLARWPGRIPAGLVRGGITSLMDLYVTSIELAGGELPTDRPIDGQDILPLLMGKGSSPHSEFFYYRGSEIFAVRSGDWKLHFLKIATSLRGLREKRKCEPPELYNLAEDPAERLDMAGRHPELVTRLTALASEFRQSVTPGKPPPKYRPILRKLKPGIL